jgi:hypothetical protein
MRYEILAKKGGNKNCPEAETQIIVLLGQQPRQFRLATQWHANLSAHLGAGLVPGRRDWKPHQEREAQLRDE